MFSDIGSDKPMPPGTLFRFYFLHSNSWARLGLFTTGRGEMNKFPRPSPEFSSDSSSLVAPIDSLIQFVQIVNALDSRMKIKAGRSV